MTYPRHRERFLRVGITTTKSVIKYGYVTAKATTALNKYRWTGGIKLDKMKYEKPTINIESLDNSDVITASTPVPVIPEERENSYFSIFDLEW